MMTNQTRPRLSMAPAAAFALVLWSAGCGNEPAGTGRPSTPPPLPQTGFKAEIRVEQAPSKLKVNESVVLDVTVRNFGNAVWPHQGGPAAAHGVLLSYHWLSADGSRVLIDGIRTNLPSDLAPGTQVALRSTIKAPDKPGAYILEFDMVQEAVAWFKERGSKAVRLSVAVE